LKVTEHFKKAKGTLFSFEILPPIKGQSINSIFDAIGPLMEFKPPFIDVTYHREEYIYREMDNGLLKKIATRKRPGTVAICGGFTKEETENALIDLNFLGIDNVLVLRGDPIKSEGSFKPEPEGHACSWDLASQVTNMNRGQYLYSETKQAPTNFCIGVAGYPEKHFESPNLKNDLTYLKKKIEAGAEYIVTQMFFDNQKYFNYVKRLRDNGITIPVVPGLKPITTLKQLTTIPQKFFIDIPEDLSDELEKCKTDAAVQQVGIEWAIQQSKELMAANVPCLHYYTMSKSEPVKQIAQALF
jgi:methylenetetrahydrofolate reductase (NADPH)